MTTSPETVSTAVWARGYVRDGNTGQVGATSDVRPAGLSAGATAPVRARVFSYLKMGRD